MTGMIDKILEALKEILISFIQSNLSRMFEDVNEKVSIIAAEVGKTPQGWNNDIFTMIQKLSENVIVPIAGMIITCVLCYELINMVMEKNNMHDMEISMFIKYFFKMGIAVFLLTHTFDINMGIFDIGQHLVNNAAEVIKGSTNIDVGTALESMEAALKEMSIGGLMVLAVESLLISLGLKIMCIWITLILYGRMIEIYLYCSVAPIPFATMTNREWGSIGNNYLKGLIALGFQGFFIMVCVGIYGVLVRTMTVSDDIHSVLFSIAVYTVLLCYTLNKTVSISKSIFNAH